MSDLSEPESSATGADPALVTLVYPGTAFRAIPEFVIDIPDDWAISEFPDALFAAGPPDTTEMVWSNVIMRHERLYPDVTLEDIAKASWEMFAAQSTDVSLIDERVLSFDTTFFLREAEIKEPDVDALSRIDAFCFSPTQGHQTIDLFQITFLHPKAHGHRYRSTYAKILSSVRFVGDGSVTA